MTRFPMTSCVGSMPRRSTRFAASIVEFEFALCEPRHNTPAHHHQFALSPLAARRMTGWKVSGGDVVIGCDGAAAVRCSADVEVLRDLLLVEEAGVAAAVGDRAQATTLTLTCSNLSVLTTPPPTTIYSK